MKSLKTSIMLLAICIATGVALLLTGYNMFHNYENTVEINTKYAETQAEKLAMEINGFISSQKGYLEGTSQALYETMDFSQPFMASYTAIMAEGNPYIIYTYFNTPTDDGHFTSSDGWIPPEDYSWQDRYWIQPVSESDDIFMEFPSYDSVTQTIVTVLRRRIYDGELYGMLNMAINLAELSNIVKAFPLPEDSYSFVVNEDDMLVAYPDVSVFSGSEEVPLITDFVDGLDTNQSMMDIGGYRYTLVEVEDTPWKVGLVIPLEWYQSGTWDVVLQNGLIFMIALILTIFFSILIAKRIITPVRELQGMVGKIGEGTYHDPIRSGLMGLPNEIGELSRVFEEMRKKIMNRTKELTEAKNTAIEARTELESSYMELQALNEEMIATEEALHSNYKELKETKEKLEYTVYHDNSGFYNEAMLKSRVEKSMMFKHDRLNFIYITTRELPFFRRTLNDQNIKLIDKMMGEILKDTIENCNKTEIYHISTGVYGLLCRNGLEQLQDHWLDSLNEGLSKIIIGETIRISLSAVIGIVEGQVLDNIKDADEIITYGYASAMEALKDPFSPPVTFTDDMYSKMLRMQQLEAALYEAIETENFKVVYQPKFDVKGKIVGAEALVRWEHAEMGSISPGIFVPMAERLGLIGVIDLLVVKNTLGLQKLIKNLYDMDFVITSNLSIQDLMDETYLKKIVSAVKRAQISPSVVAFEITETAFA